jgi:hypothetical protein
MKQTITFRATTGAYLFYLDDYGRRVWIGERPPDIDSPAPAQPDESPQS